MTLLHYQGLPALANYWNFLARNRGGVGNSRLLGTLGSVDACLAFNPNTPCSVSRLCGVGLDLKKFPAPNYFYDLHADGILAWSDLFTVTNFAHYDHAIPLYFHPRPGLHESGNGYPETRFRRAIDLARYWGHDGHNDGLVGSKTRFPSTIRHLSSKSANMELYFKRLNVASPRVKRKPPFG
jgi:hypothetical protein